ncbi:protocadherin Fat 2 [Caerostris extrusa]|uniref:Protocadherin Fat 2 n=1 Tax=Caerostris extrusa TaxID=172846 RepID=A0AAV4SQY0_CAEEX|nr:protocadherin Fat 2 [Caerostris extrusa]
MATDVMARNSSKNRAVILRIPPPPRKDCFAFAREKATQTDNSLRTAMAKVDVQVLDVNDNVPEFEYEMYNITVMENLPPGFTVVQVSAFDEDSGDNAEFRYELEDESGAFSIDPTGGSISVKDPSKLDRETKDLIRMRVFAKEKKPNVNPNVKATPAIVEVHLLDANDNNPKVCPKQCLRFQCHRSRRTRFRGWESLDPDLDVNGVVRYRLQNDSLSQMVPFDVHPENGSIYILESFKNIREKPPRYTFFVQASDLARIESERRSSVAVVNVNIQDINNNAPEFIGAPYEAFIGESLPPGALVYQLQAKDPDADTVLEFSIVAGNDEGNFVVNPSRGQVLTAAVMDYEKKKKQSYDLLVQVSDGINTAVSPMTVNVVDINDQQPVFTHSYYNFSIVEEMQENVTVGSILALDGDSGRNAIVRYKLLGDQAKEAFEIDEAGNILSKRRLDREKEAMIDFLVVAFDAGTPQLSGTATVGVRVEDINDSPPYFDSDTYVVSVPEEEAPPYTVHKMHAKDDDTGDNAVLKYLIVGGNEEKMFTIDEDNGVVTTAEKLNFERQSEYVLHVAARNVKPFQGPQASALANPFVKLVIKVMDVNDELVAFDRQSYQFRIPENLPRSERIGFLNATNPHRSPKDQSILYWIGDGNSQERFWINPRTGELVLTESVDRDPPNNQQVFQLRVFARDQFSSNVVNTSVPVVIVIDDVNDNTPTFDEERYALELPENLPLGTTLPPFSEPKDIDAGPNGKIDRYYTNGSDDVFLVNNATGAITLISNLDYEANDQHEFTVFAVDGGRPARIGSANVVIKVQNINEFAPDFVGLPYDFRAEESAVRAFFMIDEDTGVVYVKKDLDARTRFSFIARATDDGVPQNNSIGVQVIAVDRDLQNNTVSYSIKNGNEAGIFELNSSSGEIFVIPSEASRVDYDQTKSYSLLIEAIDSHTTSLYGLAMVTIDVIDTNDHPPVFSQMSYSSSLAENLPAGHCFLQMANCSTWDLVKRPILRSILNPKTGDVCTKQVLDREEQDTYEFVVIALDGKFETKSPVVIRVLDQNDNPPKFERERYYVSIPPHSQAGRTIIQVLATDPDTGSNGEVTYWIKNSHGHFDIDTQTGHIRLSSALPSHMQKNMTYEMEIFARDHGAASNIGKATLVVKVSSTRNHPPKFEKFGYRVAVDENAANVDLLNVHAYDPDTGPSGRLRYRIVRSTKREAFRIDGTSGRITLVTPLDYEKTKYLELLIEARDESKEPQFATTVVQVTVNDLNDNAPEFLALPHLLRVPLSTSLSEVVYTVKATDADSPAGGNSLLTYELQPPSSQFSINKKTGQITPSQPLSPSTETLRIKATDGANIPLSSTVDLLVEVYKDTIDDPTPVFTSVQYSVNADGILEAGTTVLDVRATVPNGSPVFYNITGPEDTLIRGFNIDRETGRITTTTRLSADQETLYHFLVAASNRNDQTRGAEAGVVVQLSDVSVVPSSHFRNISLSDASIRCPKFPFDRRKCQPDSVVLPYLQVEDAHIFDRLSYQITEDNSNDNFFIDTMAFNVTASNQRCSGNTRLNIFVEDVNDNSPLFEKKDFLVEVKENAPPGHVVVHLTAMDKDELDMNKLRYFIIDGNSDQQFQIEESTGVLSVRVSPDREETPVFSLSSCFRFS